MASSTSVTLAPYQSSYIDLALSSGILRFDGPFTLKSGRSSPYFFNAGLFNTGSKIAKVAECYAQRIIDSGVEFDVLFGPAYKGIPLAAATAMALQLHHGLDVGYCFNRKEAKTHGEGGSLVGAPLKGRVLILDDVITAGTAINEAMQILHSQPDAKLVGVVIALDRQEKSSQDGVEGETSAIKQVEKRYNTNVYSVVNLDQIIEFMSKDESDEVRQKVQSMKEYRKRYGVSDVAKAEAEAAKEAQ
ncbi:orotate phosphoribosyltransferase [Thecaphora frezii]